MREYTQLCLQGESSIPQRQRILTEQRQILNHRLQDIEDAIAYIDTKQQFYESVVDGRLTYVSNILDDGTDEPVTLPACME